MDHPVCLECAVTVREALEAQVAEVEADCEAYEACLRQLETEGADEGVISDDEFERELKRMQMEEDKQRGELKRIQAQLAAVQAEKAGLEVASQELDQLEERYWHDFNNFKLQLQVEMIPSSHIVSVPFLAHRERVFSMLGT